MRRKEGRSEGGLPVEVVSRRGGPDGDGTAAAAPAGSSGGQV